LVVRGACNLAAGKAAIAAADIQQENQAVKRQKLHDGGVRQVGE
jgi:targeting protein for Xklp2